MKSFITRKIYTTLGKKTVRAKDAREQPQPSVLLRSGERPGVGGGGESASVAHGGRRSSPVAARANERGRACQRAAPSVRATHLDGLPPWRCSPPPQAEPSCQRGGVRHPPPSRACV